MTKEHMDLLTITEYYMILSGNTKKPYLDRNFNVAMFESPTEADEYAKSASASLDGKDMLSVKEKTLYKVRELCPELYSMGANGINLFKRGQSALNIPVTKEDAKRSKKGVLFNPEVSRFVIRAQETNQKRYLRSLYNQHFYAPVFIEKRQKGQYPHVSYCYASFKTEDRYYILFTSLEEFTKWNMLQNNEYSPLEVKINTFDCIRNKNAVLINPISNKLFLTNNTFNIIKSKGEKA